MAASKPAMPESLKRSVEASKTEYKRLGRSGLKVSVPILGAMSFGNSQWMDWVLEEEKVYPNPPSPDRNLLFLAAWNAKCINSPCPS